MINLIDFVYNSDYQIVNGCQTSNVLFNNMNMVDLNNLQIIVKLIASKDKEIQTSIIVGNNSQTEVKREQLVSLLESQKAIEDYIRSQKAQSGEDNEEPKTEKEAEAPAETTGEEQTKTTEE